MNLGQGVSKSTTLRELIMAELTFVDGESQKDKFCGVYFFGWEKTRSIKFFLHSSSLFQHKIHIFCFCNHFYFKTKQQNQVLIFFRDVHLRPKHLYARKLMF